ncbi:MAG: hypothetical protein KDI07_03280 [Anaerolineae bacterium]|nr:hypothetical protein [Anaerolineae bacterium]MCB0234944.1 hypothetical protein [Anaerolineae bacterium]MCB0247574.1 hypothetical protein [Anaerolineae bacterium]MCB9133310.1 hypothetical protein [Anaerolineales bacterium]
MPQNDYRTAAASYAEGLRTLFAPSQESTRSVLRVATEDELADRADSLVAQSATLIGQTAEYLADDDMATRLGAEQSLLAQAAASLRAADGLLAIVDADGGETTRSAGAGRPSAGFDDLLALIDGSLEEIGAQVEPEPEMTRGGANTTPADLIETADDAIRQVVAGVGTFARGTVASLVGLDPALLKQAAGMLGSELSQALTKLGENVTRLVSKAVAFIVQAYDSLLAALGQDAASALRVQAAEWVEKLQQGEALTELADALYQTDDMKLRVAALIEGSGAPGPVLGKTQSDVEALSPSFQSRIKLAGQIRAGLGLLKFIPAAKGPLELATGVLYLALLGYVVVAGADYVDAPRLARIGRVPGVLETIQTGLIPA